MAARREDQREASGRDADAGADARKPAARDLLRFRFEHTVFFSDLAASAPWDDSAATELKPGHSGVLDEVRLQPDLWQRTLHGAILRVLADRDADGTRPERFERGSRRRHVRFRRERDLHDSPELVAWLAANDLDGKAFIELMENQTRLGWLLQAHQEEALTRVPDELRASGRLAELRPRAQEKEHWIDTNGLAMVPLAELGLRETDVLSLVLRPMPATGGAG